jgi:hypothetical protein
MEETQRQLKHQHRVYCLGRSPAVGDPSKRAGVPSHYRLGVDTGEWSGRETRLDGEIFPQWSQPSPSSLGEARGR